MAEGKGILALLATPKGDSKGSSDGGGDPLDELALDVKEQAVKDLFSAAESKDWAAAAEAFKRAYDACAEAHKTEAGSGGESIGEEY